MPLRTLMMLLTITSTILAPGCGDDTTSDEASNGDTTTSRCTEAQEVACVDDMILDLSFHNTVSTSTVENSQDGADWVTSVDATAGGFQNAANNPWVYIKFTAQGAEKVEISDEEALESLEWHIAAHRFKLRLNSGNGGPSCVTAAAMLESDYTTLNASPDGLTYYEESFYSADCTLIEDSYGLGSPQVFMSNWWEYPGCVATTGVPYLLQLDDGRIMKLKVEAYYASGQDSCNAHGSMGSGSGNFTWRWRFL